MEKLSEKGHRLHAQGGRDRRAGVPEVDLEVVVTRFDPDIDRAPYQRSYEMAVPVNQTILDLLMDLQAYADPSIAFRRACRSGICGTCAMVINGKPSLACETLVSTVLNGGNRVVIEPLPHFRVMKDLVVDIEPFLDSLKRVAPWMVLRPEYDGKMRQEEVRRLEKANECILCGICQADGTAADSDPEARLNPASMVKAFRIGSDPRDALGNARARLAQDLGILQRPIDATGRLGCPKQIDFGGQIVPSLRSSVAE